MRRRSGILGILIVVALVVGSETAQTFAAGSELPIGRLIGHPVKSNQPPVGCHDHGTPTPAPTPSRECCLIGHNVAAVQLSSAPRPDVHHEPGGEIEPLPSQSFFIEVAPVAIPSSDPSPSTPLRI